MRIKHRGQALATIYGKSKAYPAYRLAWRVTGKRRMERFQTYGEAKRKADALVKELAQGTHVTALTPRQATDALAALERLQSYFQQTGRRISLLSAVTECVEANVRLNGRTVPEAIDGYLANVASVKRKDLAEAVEEFCESRESKAVAGPGKRSALSPVYVADTARQLREFAASFPAHTVCDLAKTHLDAYLGAHGKLSPKSRNHHRSTLRMFLGWCVRQDYLTANPRLLEADGLRKEPTDTAPVDYYRPDEVRALLENSTGQNRRGLTRTTPSSSFLRGLCLGIQ
ncbi:MAG: hypothetical protein ACLQVY_25700 [Limisphaerales bacterium]